MHVEHLMTFAAVAHLRSFTRAAHVLSISQSAVSQQIRELELYFGQTLFERTTRRLALTLAGERLLTRATDMIAQLRAAKAELGEISGRPGGQLAIGCTTTIAIYRLPPIITELRRHADLLRLSVRVGPLPDLAQAILSGEIEVILATQQLPTAVRGDFCHDAFARDEIVVIVKAGHRWTEMEALEPQELAGEPLVARREGSPTRALVFEALGNLGVQPALIPVELGNTEAIKKAVEEGLGFGFASRSAVSRELATGRLAQVNVRGLELTRELWLITPPAARRSDRAEIFRELLVGQSPSASRPAGVSA